MKNERWSYAKHAKEYVRWTMSVQNRRVSSSRRQFSITKTGTVDGKGNGDVGRTYVDVALHVSNEDEVASAGVADVGIDGDGPARVPLDGVGQLRGVTGDEAVSDGAGAVDETGSGGG